MDLGSPPDSGATEVDSAVAVFKEECVVRAVLNSRCVVLEVPVALVEFGVLTPMEIRGVNRVSDVPVLVADRAVPVVPAVFVDLADEGEWVDPNQRLAMAVRECVVQNPILVQKEERDRKVFGDLTGLALGSVDLTVQEIAGALVVRKMSEINEDPGHDVPDRMKIVRNVESLPSHLTGSSIN